MATVRVGVVQLLARHEAVAKVSLDLTKFYIRDMDSKGDITISVGEPSDWRELFSDHLESYGLWKGVVENVKTRYVRVTLHGSESNISELVLYKKLF